MQKPAKPDLKRLRGLFVSRKPLARRLVQKRLMSMMLKLNSSSQEQNRNKKAKSLIEKSKEASVNNKCIPHFRGWQTIPTRRDACANIPGVYPSVPPASPGDICFPLCFAKEKMREKRGIYTTYRVFFGTLFLFAAAAKSRGELCKKCVLCREAKAAIV